MLVQPEASLCLPAAMGRTITVCSCPREASGQPPSIRRCRPAPPDQRARGVLALGNSMLIELSVE